MPIATQNQREGVVYKGHVEKPTVQSPKRAADPSPANRPKARRRTECDSFASAPQNASATGSVGSPSEPAGLTADPLVAQPAHEPAPTNPHIGLYVRKLFPGGHGLYDGKVTKYDAYNGKFLVMYSDGDSETMLLPDLSPLLFDPAQFVLRCQLQKCVTEDGGGGNMHRGRIASWDHKTYRYEVVWEDEDTRHLCIKEFSKYIVPQGAPHVVGLGRHDSGAAGVAAAGREPPYSPIFHCKTRAHLEPPAPRYLELQPCVAPAGDVADAAAGAAAAAAGAAAAGDVAAAAAGAAVTVVTRADAPTVDVQNGSMGGTADSSLCFVEAAASEESESEDEDAIEVPETVATLHAALLAKHARETEAWEATGGWAVHQNYELSGVTIPHAVPKYLKPTKPTAMLDWLEGQGRDEEFKDTAELNDNNCKLDFAEWVLRCQISHREWRHLWELMNKWLPAGTAFPDRDDGEPCGKKHPGAHLLRLVRTRKSLEEYLDKRCAAYSQACHIPPVNVNSAHVYALHYRNINLCYDAYRQLTSFTHTHTHARTHTHTHAHTHIRTHTRTHTHTNHTPTHTNTRTHTHTRTHTNTRTHTHTHTHTHTPWLHDPRHHAVMGS